MNAAGSSLSATLDRSSLTVFATKTPSVPSKNSKPDSANGEGTSAMRRSGVAWADVGRGGMSAILAARERRSKDHRVPLRRFRRSADAIRWRTG